MTKTSRNTAKAPAPGKAVPSSSILMPTRAEGNAKEDMACESDEEDFYESRASSFYEKPTT